MKEHPKTRRKKGAAKLYTPGELNELIDSAGGKEKDIEEFVIQTHDRT